MRKTRWNPGSLLIACKTRSADMLDKSKGALSRYRGVQFCYQNPPVRNLLISLSLLISVAYANKYMNLFSAVVGTREYLETAVNLQEMCLGNGRVGAGPSRRRTPRADGWNLGTWLATGVVGTGLGVGGYTLYKHLYTKPAAGKKKPPGPTRKPPTGKKPTNGILPTAKPPTAEDTGMDTGGETKTETKTETEKDELLMDQNDIDTCDAQLHKYTTYVNSNTKSNMFSVVLDAIIPVIRWHGPSQHPKYSRADAKTQVEKVFKKKPFVIPQNIFEALDCVIYIMEQSNISYEKMYNWFRIFADMFQNVPFFYKNSQDWILQSKAVSKHRLISIQAHIFAVYQQKGYTIEKIEFQNLLFFMLHTQIEIDAMMLRFANVLCLALHFQKDPQALEKLLVKYSNDLFI